MASLQDPVPHPEIEIYFDHIETRTEFSAVRDLLAEWRRVAHEDRGVPVQERFSAHLTDEGGANLMLLRRVNSDFYYEAVGDEIKSMFGHDPTGRLISELPYRGAQAFLPRYRYCIEAGAPLFTVQRRISFGIPGSSERLLLPLKARDGSDGMLVYVRSRADNYDLIRAVFNASQHGVLVVSAVRSEDDSVDDFEVQAVNTAAATLIGRDPGELVGQPLTSLFQHLDLEPRWLDLLVSLETGETRVFESRRPQADGDVVYRISSARVGDGLAISISDLTQLHKAMKTLETQHASLVKVNAELRSEVVRRRRLEAELKELAATDPLTGIANRRSFNEAMIVHLEGARPATAPASLILFDIDDFKAINDRFGHPAGDAVLQGIARLVGQCVDDTVVFGRLGGEEFAVFLPEAAADRARETAEVLRRAIAEASHGPEGARFNITASFGVATMSSPLDAEKLVNLADEALYAAKRSGRNRVECGRGVEPRRDAGAA